jgi:hypothetical protein
MHEPLQVNLPAAQLEIKIVLPIAFPKRLPGGCRRRAGVLLGDSPAGLERDNQAAQQEKNLDVFAVHRRPL